MGIQQHCAAVLASVVLLVGCAGHVPEYLEVDFEPDASFALGGNCPHEVTGAELTASDVHVLIEGECHGRVGEIIPLTTGSFEVSVDVKGAVMQVVELERTTPENPKSVTIRIDESK